VTPTRPATRHPRVNRSVERMATARFAIALTLLAAWIAAAVASAHAWEITDAPRFVQRWDELSPRERGEARRNYDRYQRLPPDKRRAVDENYDRWRQLPPEEKQRIRGNYEQYRQMSPDEKRDFQQRFDHWKGGR